MEVEFAFLARAAEPAADGTLNVLGGDFGRVNAGGFPALLPPLMVVVKFKPAADVKLELKYEVAGPSGTVLSSGEDWHVARSEQMLNSGARSGSRLLLALPPAVVTVSGIYTATVKFRDGGEVALPLEVLSPEEG